MGEKIFDELVKLEKKLWDREDYGEEDIPLFSNAMDFISEHKEDFIKFFDGENR